MNSPVPYCGAPPVPGHIGWNTDPVLATILVACAGLYVFGIRRKPVKAWEQGCFWAGWVLTSLALLSPLCNLSVALFSARIGQHVLLTTLAAPLMSLGRCERILVAPRRDGLDAATSLFGLMSPSMRYLAPVIIFAVVMWIWHVPSLYDATFASTAVYWCMHASMIGAALLLWSTSLRSTDSMGGVLCGLIATMIQMSLLGAILTFAARPLFAVHETTTWPWGLSQMQDQQLGGLVMWVVGGLFVTGWAVVVLAEYLLRASQENSAAASSY